MYLLVLSKNYKRSYNLLLKSGRKNDIKKLEQVVDMILAGKLLDKKFQDHKLNGKLSDYKECHIKTDFLLIYKKDKEKKILFLFNIGNHNDLFE
ncbi:MAG: RelE/StbE family addiction module toxin [Parcubacteria group bacterium Athens0714_16]|nr:MAG: RelE/StbE family addiction module toxin [Parcubacteria group bacterium Athens0714_16]